MLSLSAHVFYNVNVCSELPLIPPVCEGLPPVSWWDGDADKSLLVGTYKHGFERYNMMRLDPALCFLAKCGPPDNAAVQVRIQKTDEYGRVSVMIETRREVSRFFLWIE